MDTGFVLKDTKLGDLGSGFVLQGRQDYYAPTSLASQSAGEMGETRSNLAIAKSIGKLDLKIQEEFRYYLQQYETNTFLSNNGTPLANVNYRLMSLLDVGYNFTSKFSVSLETGFINEVLYPDSFNNTPSAHNDYIEMNPAIDYSFNKYLTLEFGVWEVYNMVSTPSDANGLTGAPPSQSYSPLSPLNSYSGGNWGGSEAYLQATVKF